MKLDKKSSRQEMPPPPSQRSQLQKNSNLQSKCPRCKSVPKKLKQPPQIQMIGQKKPKQVIPAALKEQRSQRTKKSKSVYEQTDPGFHNETLTSALKKKEMKRASNSYSKLTQDESQLEDSTTIDQFFEKKYKKSQNQLLSTKSRLYENECEMENLQAELKKAQKENALLREKAKHRDLESQQCIKKAIKYKQLAKNLKISLETRNSQLEHLKTTSSEEIKGLQKSLQMLEKIIGNRSSQYTTNLKTIMSYLQKIQRMMVQSDQNYGFNTKILNDVMELIGQFQKSQIDDDESLKESLMSNCFLSNGQNNELEFVFSQTTNNDYQTGNKNPANHIGKGDLSHRTKQLLNDYEKLKYESERLKEENKALKHHKHIYSLEESQEATNFNSKDSEKPNQLQSLSVADILQFDSVQKLNNKLEEKNKYLEDQINVMRKQMSDLTNQTHQLLQERENQQLQVLQQRSHLMSITEEFKSQTNSSEKYERINFTENAEPSEDTKTKKYYQEIFKHQESRNSYQSPTITETIQNRDIQQELEYPVPRLPLPSQDRREQTQRLPLKQIIKGSNSTNILVSNIDTQRSGVSKMTSNEGSRTKTNIFKRNCYLESEKENIVSARDERLNTIDFSQNQSNKRQSFVTQNIASPSSFTAQEAQNQKQEKKQKESYKRPMSLGSTSTNMINEKARALRDEISTLDQEILQLQTNLRKAILKKDGNQK